MEHRQRVQQMVGRAEIDARRQLPPVREQIGMAQHDPFRRALRPRGEQDHRRVGCGDAEPAMPRGGEIRRDEAVQLVDQAERGAQILEPDDLDRFGQRRRQGIELCQLDEAAGGDDEAQLGGAARRQHGITPAVWFSIAGTRPVACKARNATPAPIEFGSITPTASPRPVPRANRRPSTRLAAITRL